MFKKHNDADKARKWPREHWHVSVFVLGVVVFVAAVLVRFHVLSPAAAVAAFLACVVFVVWTTWQATRRDNSGNERPKNG